MATRVAPPAADEYAEFHKGYIAAVANETDGLATLERQQAAIERMARLTPEQAAFRYADGKWSVKEVTGHLTDGERILAYRLLRTARGDQTPLPGYDENVFAANSNADRREQHDLATELATVRASTLSLVKSLDDDAFANRTTVNSWSLSARSLVFIIAGHFQHHLNILRDRYKIELQ